MKINRQELIKALEAVRPGLASKEIVEQSMSFVFNEGRVYCYNDLIAISHPTAKGLAGAVQATELHKLLMRSSDEEIEITTTETEMLIKGKRSEAGITLQAEIKLPLDEISEKRTWINLPEGFSEAVSFALLSAGQDTTRTELTCVYINGQTVETTDNLRLTQVFLPGKGLKASLLVPARAAKELTAYKPTHYAVPVVNDCTPWVHFMNKAGTEFSCRLIEAKFPDLSSVMARKGKSTIKFHEDTAAILDRACVFLSDKTVTPLVKISIAEGRMEVSAKGNIGWFKEKVRVRFEGAVEFRINPAFLKDMLPLLKEAVLTDDGRVLKFTGENFIHCCAAASAEA